MCRIRLIDEDIAPVLPCDPSGNGKPHAKPAVKGSGFISSVKSVEKPADLLPANIAVCIFNNDHRIFPLRVNMHIDLSVCIAVLDGVV